MRFVMAVSALHYGSRTFSDLATPALSEGVGGWNTVEVQGILAFLCLPRHQPNGGCQVARQLWPTATPQSALPNVNK